MAVSLDFEKGNGMLPAVVQDYRSGKVLMLAFMNREAWQLTLQTGGLIIGAALARSFGIKA